ncbi:MAG: amidohydrolase family protein [Oscillospiraceae bacterium]|nr:amidohydrolase family protein [Oscillospiraceae bacterium]
MKTTILKGNIVAAPELGKLDIVENGCLVAVDGVIEGVYETLPEQFAGCEIEDCGKDLILQTFSDMHLHAPQYAMLGMGMDMPLIDWLNTYTFPTESHFADPEVARPIYRQLAEELVSNGTTRVVMFSSLHRESTLVLMEELEKAGVTGYVGKVNMDRNGGENYQETTQESMDETVKWIEQCDFEHVKPVITPRFTPTCTNELMEFLGKLAAEKNLPIQSHLSENTGEIAWVKELHPDCQQYWETYAKYNMWNDRTVMAHCVWSDERERKAIKDAGVWVCHCASSNEDLISGYAPIRVMLDEGVRVVLGSDIAGGDHISMFDNVTASIRASKARRIMTNWETDFLTVAEAYYLGTSAACEFFGEKPGFAAGNPLHAIVLRDNDLPDVRQRTTQERFERSMYRRQKDAIRAVYSAGRKVYSAD